MPKSSISIFVILISDFIPNREADEKELEKKVVDDKFGFYSLAYPRVLVKDGTLHEVSNIAF